LENLNLASKNFQNFRHANLSFSENYANFKPILLTQNVLLFLRNFRFKPNLAFAKIFTNSILPPTPSQISKKMTAFYL